MTQSLVPTSGDNDTGRPGFSSWELTERACSWGGKKPLQGARPPALAATSISFGRDPVSFPGHTLAPPFADLAPLTVCGDASSTAGREGASHSGAGSGARRGGSGTWGGLSAAAGTACGSTRRPARPGDKVPPRPGDRAVSRGRNTEGTAQEVIRNRIVNRVGAPGGRWEPPASPPSEGTRRTSRWGGPMAFPVPVRPPRRCLTFAEKGNADSPRGRPGREPALRTFPLAAARPGPGLCSRVLAVSPAWSGGRQHGNETVSMEMSL